LVGDRFRWRRRRRRERDLPSADDSLGPGEPRGAEDDDGRAAAQALDQQQTVFERQLQKDRDLFALHLAMGWTTYLMAPANIVAAIVYPPALVGLLPLTGLAVWNWRRMLRRDRGELEPTTRPPADA